LPDVRHPALDRSRSSVERFQLAVGRLQPSGGSGVLMVRLVISRGTDIFRTRNIMYRTLVICRHTFQEAVAQPIFSLLIALGSAVLFVFAMLPFFTLGEDTRMFKSIGLDVVLILVLISTLFATSKSIFEEIEDRTMLTLMSKPVRRWEVMVGKYLGIISSAALAVGVLGVVIVLCTWFRVPTDYQLRTTTIDDRELNQILDLRLMHSSGLIPSLVLIWLQIGVLAAVGVALSTRFSLVVNLPAVILVYIAGNLTRFLFPLNDPGSPLYESGFVAKGFAYLIGLVLPYLETFDLRTLTVYGTVRIPEWLGNLMNLRGSAYTADPSAVAYGTIWGYVAVAVVYAVAYSAFALAAGMWSFHNRELGGNEG